MDDVTHAIESLPPAGAVPLILLIVVGVVLWGAGRRVLRAAFAAVGLIVGASIGWAVAAEHPIGGSPWILTLVAGVTLACVSALVYRLVLAAALAVVVGVLGPATVVTMSELSARGPGEDAEAAPAPAEARSLPGDLVDEANQWLLPEPGDADAAPAALPTLRLDRETVKNARADASRLVESGRSWWDRVPERLRPILIAAAAAGGLAGLLLGTLAPAITAVVVSSFGGSLLWMSGIRVLIASAGDPVGEWMAASPAWFVVAWLIISLLGVAIQWTFRPKQADKAG